MTTAKDAYPFEFVWIDVVSVETAHLPADIARRSSLIGGSLQPGRPARAYAHINVTEY
jgi:hypothetical protein